MKATSSLGGDYQKANQAAVDSVASEAKEVKRVRRIGAVVAYINNPTLPITDNINAEKKPGSFINFVCAGADDFEITMAGLSYTTDYAKTVKSITDSPEDSISGYIAALSELKGKGKPLSPPEVKKNQFESCRQSVEGDLPPKGITAVTARKESIAVAIAAVTALQALLETLNKLAKDGLKMATEAEQKATLKEFIKNNREAYSRVLSEDLSSDELAHAFERRRQIAIAIPYYEFIDMMRLSSVIDRVAILRYAERINQDLSEYDALRNQNPPAQLVTQFKVINEKLDDYANGKISIADLRQFLAEIASELQEAKKDYDAVSKAIPTATAAAGIK
ncbi:hypothetical protein [Cupriavidus sp. 8B]